MTFSCTSLNLRNIFVQIFNHFFPNAMRLDLATRVNSIFITTHVLLAKFVNYKGTLKKSWGRGARSSKIDWGVQDRQDYELQHLRYYLIETFSSSITPSEMLKSKCTHELACSKLFSFHFLYSISSEKSNIKEEWSKNQNLCTFFLICYWSLANFFFNCKIVRIKIVKQKISHKTVTSHYAIRQY